MKIPKYFCFLLFFIPLLSLRDFTPNNELKYLSIADEAIRNSHFFAFWNHGAAYADKPPLYLWIVMLGKWLLGEHCMLFISLFSIIPALVILYVMDKWVKTVIPAPTRLSGQLMLITSGLFTGSAIVIRMDMLMCLFIVLSIYTFYKIYTGTGSVRDPLLFPVYIFLAVFTKGPVGILVPLTSIPVFLFWQGKLQTFGKYFGWKQWSILIGLCLIWFGAVYLEGGKTYLDNLLFNQTVNRAIDSFHHKEPVWFYLKTIWYSLAPWILFYVVTIISGIRKHLINTDLKKLFLTVIVTTFTALSLFSGKLDIYMLPVFPFIAYLAILLLPDLNGKYLSAAIAIPAGILLLVFPGIFILNKIPGLSVPNTIAIPIAALVLSISSLLSLRFLWKKSLLHAVNSLAAGLLLTIFIGSFSLSELNPYIGFQEMSKKAQTIANEKGIKNYYFYKFRSGENIDAYLHQEIKQLGISELNSQGRQQEFILFVRNKDVKKDPELEKIIGNKESYNIGNYSIVLFQLNDN